MASITEELDQLGSDSYNGLLLAVENSQRHFYLFLHQVRSARLLHSLGRTRDPALAEKKLSANLRLLLGFVQRLSEHLEIVKSQDKLKLQVRKRVTPERNSFSLQEC